MRFKNLLLPVILLLIAAFFRTWQIDRVPPGLHYDETINAQIVADQIFAGQPSIFYDAGGGREGLFFLTLAASVGVWDFTPIGMRWPSLAWSLIGLAAIYALTKRLLGQRVALITLAFAAVTFWPVFQGRAALRAISLVAMGALAAYAFFVALDRKRRRDFVLAGVLLGLSIYTYHAARVLPLVFVGIIGYLFITQRPTFKATWHGLIVFTVVAMAIAAPLFIYLRSNPALDVRTNDLMQTLNEFGQGNVSPLLNSTLQTLGMFVWRGDAEWHYNLPGTPVFDPFSSVLFIIGLLVALWANVKSRTSSEVEALAGNGERSMEPAKASIPAARLGKLPYAFYLIWLAISLVPGMVSEPAPHYYRTTGAQVAAYVFVGIGAVTIIDWLAKRRPALNRAAWLALIGVWLIGAARTYQNLFVIWPVNDEVRLYHQANLTEMARYLDSQSDTTPVVGCSPFLNEREDWLRSSRQTMRFLLRRTDLPIRWHDCRDSLVFPNDGQWREFILYFTPLEQNIPPSIMKWLTDTAPVHLNEFADSTLYTLEARAKLTATLAEVSQAEVTWGSDDGPASLPIDFGHNLKLLGYHVEKPSLRAGKPLIVTTYWQVIDQAPPFLTVFMHVPNDSDQIVAQIDRQSVLADTLQPGDVFMQVHSIDLPNGLSPGSYRLSIGLYSSETNQRLPVYDGETLHGDRAMLQSITIKPPQ